MIKRRLRHIFHVDERPRAAAARLDAISLGDIKSLTLGRPGRHARDGKYYFS